MGVSVAGCLGMVVVVVIVVIDIALIVVVVVIICTSFRPTRFGSPTRIITPTELHEHPLQGGPVDVTSVAVTCTTND